MDIPASSIGDLLQNADFVSSLHDNEKDGKPSACEVKCSSQQTALVACMDIIRQQSETSDAKSNRAVNACLSPSVTAWTECCSKASLEEVK